MFVWRIIWIDDLFRIPFAKFPTKSDSRHKGVEWIGVYLSVNKVRFEDEYDDEDDDDDGDDDDGDGDDDDGDDDNGNVEQ